MMDKDFEKKVKRKRLRAIAVSVIVIAIAAFIIWDMDIEKADYSDSLKEEIRTAEKTFAEQKDNKGNEKGQYAAYTLSAYEKQIERAKKISQSEESEYNDKKDAYENLKAQTKAFKGADNRDVLEKADIEKLASGDQSENYTVEIKDGKKITYTVKGSAIKKPVTMNLMAREEGPNYEDINGILSVLSLQGQVVSFYQEGTFGGKLHVTIPIYSEKATTGYVYKVDLKNAKLEYVSEADLSLKDQRAAFDIDEGGDYLILVKKLHEDASDKNVDIMAAKKEAAARSGGDASPADDSKAKDITVSMEIRCDTLSEDLSKLEDPALKDYVPSDGKILPATEITVKEGATVFDVLNKVCRNKKIQLETSYTPTYGSYYVEGINYLYEFDGGNLSGWMYKVNGKFPNYGCSGYTLKDGDQISWLYTCDLGKDVGNDNMQ